MVTIAQMKQQGVEIGSRLEITLFEGADYYNGYTEAPTTNPEGFDPIKTMTENPGSKYLGFVHEFNYKYNRITLSMGRGRENSVVPAFDGNRFYYFDEKVIHSYAVLSEKR